jgi:hypothetical protein
MQQQPTSSKTIPIDVDNGGYKKKGNKILVLPQYTIAEKQVYEEFCDLTKRKTSNDHDIEMLDSDDATQVNANVKEHTDQLKAMFASDEFPAIETPVSLTDIRFETSNSDSSNYKCKSKKKKPKKPKGQKSTKHQRIDRKRERENRDGMVSEASSKSHASTESSTSRVSYSSVVLVASRTAAPPSTLGSGRGSDLDMAELKEMMRVLMQQNVEERKEAKIAQREACKKG